MDKCNPAVIPFACETSEGKYVVVQALNSTDAIRRVRDEYGYTPYDVRQVD